MKIVNLEQGTREWHEHRNNHIGGSDAPSVMGIGFMTPYQLHLNKLGLYNIPTNPMMQRGHDLEPQARSLLNARTGLIFEPICAVSSEIDYIAASLDGIASDGSCITEIKTGGEKAAEIAKAGIVPDKYICQIQHQLYVTELEKCIYCFFDGSEIFTIDVYRDDKYINNLIKTEKKFWEGLINFKAPELTEKDYVPRDGDYVILAKEMADILERKKELELREEAIRGQMIVLAEDKNSIGGGIKMTRVPRQGAIDYKQIDVLRAVDLEKFRKPSMITWRFSKT